ncbi:MAG: DUF134 domain-containing protein [Candidatus Aenigmarchaeota archaeon]|nr:DUF134 domain-containing protein [Candidatus Aenigmarchaeota archaeon]
MPIPRRCRRVGFQPRVTYFKPMGIRMIDLRELVLSIDELEAVRLKDLLGLGQKEAAMKMDISQPTFHRLLMSARKKIADAIVNGNVLKIKGGNYNIMLSKEGNRFAYSVTNCRCSKCDYEESKERGIQCASKKCPKCGNMMIKGD